MTDTATAPHPQTLTEKARTLAEEGAASVSDTAAVAADEARSLFARAQDALGQAVDSTVEAFRERPLTSAAIAGGVVAAAAGATYGVKKLLEDTNDTGSVPSPKRAKK